MGYQKYVRTLDHTDRLPSRFILNLALKMRNLVRAVENQRSGFEADTVLSLVDTILLLVPAEPQRAISVLTIMYIHQPKSPAFAGQRVYTALRIQKGLS